MNEFFSRAIKQDDVIWPAVQNELKRQNEQIELIASENIVSPAVLAAQGSVFTNKYAEGYPGRRYYGGGGGVGGILYGRTVSPPQHLRSPPLHSYTRPTAP